MVTFAGSMLESKDLPTAAITRPQLGSHPYTAVFTKGELTTHLATRFACGSLLARLTSTVISLVAPSPPRAISLVKYSQTANKAFSKGAGFTGPARPLAISTTVSLVLVSVSVLRQLNVRSATRFNIGRSTALGSSLSVIK